MNSEKQKAFIIQVIYIALILVLVYVVIKYILPLLMPFIIGMIVAVAFRHLIDSIGAKAHLKRVFVSIIILIIFYAIIGLITSLIGFKVINFLGDLFNSIPKIYQHSILPALQTIIDNIITRFPDTKAYLNDFMNNIDESTLTFLTKTSSTVVGTLTGFASHIPSLVVKFIFTIVSSFFFTIDYYKISEFLMRQLKKEKQEILLRIKHNGFGTLTKFIRAYALIITITFLELSVGFWILGIPSPLLYGGLVAVIDIMPIVGTGAVLIPWCIIGFILGNVKIGVGMLLLYIVVTIVRQTIEPKIVGQQIGLHPIVTLILMYVGAQLMGVLGLLILPVMATLLLKLNDEGTIHLFKKADS